MTEKWPNKKRLKDKQQSTNNGQETEEFIGGAM